MPSATLMGDCEDIAASSHSSTTGFYYRPVSVQDPDALALIYLAAYPPEVAASYLDQARTEMLGSFAGDFGTLLMKASLGAYHGDQLVGAILVVERSPCDPNLDCLFGIDLFVGPRWQGNGVGRRLVGRSAQACIDEGRSRMALRIGDGTSPAAKRIYASAGMVEIDPDKPPAAVSPPAPAVSIDRGQEPSAVDRILRSLPDWLGIEEAINNYVESASKLDSFLAVMDGEAVGVALIERHFPESAELNLIAVQADKQGRGIGGRLLESITEVLTTDGCQLLQVHTVGPSSEDNAYAQTRRFYLQNGFLPLQEPNRLGWPITRLGKAARKLNSEREPPVRGSSYGPYSVESTAGWRQA